MSRIFPAFAASGCVWLCLTFALCGCSSDSAARAPAGTGGSGGGSGEAPTLRFTVDNPGQTQALFPEEIKEFEVVASPPGIYRVRFSIVPVEQMPPHDASLDRTDTDTSEEGVATVTLRAPSIVTVFDLQATIGPTSSAAITIGVQAKGQAELQVVPEYEGERRVSAWVANAYMNIRCSELSQKVASDRGLPTDSTSFSATSVFGIPPRIKQVPVGPFMAVTVRAGHYVFGCTNVDQTLTNELNTVRVAAANRAIVLNDVELDISMNIGETTDTWESHLQQATDTVMLAFTDETESDPALLLDVMQELVDDADSRADFQVQRLAGKWELLALQSLASADSLLLRRKFASWLEAGSRALSTEAAFNGRIAGGSAAEAQFKLTRVAGVDAERAGFDPSVVATWTADPSDTVALGATLRWSPSVLVTTLAESQAVTEYPDASQLSEAFAELVDCQKLAESLQLDPSETTVFNGCNVDCTTELCQTALMALGDPAKLTTDGEQTLQLSATGAAVVDDESRLVSFEGSWRGTIPTGEGSAVGGTIVGVQLAGAR